MNNFENHELPLNRASFQFNTHFMPIETQNGYSIVFQYRE